MNLATTIDIHGLGGEKRSLFQVGDAVTYDMIGPDGHLHGTYLGRVVEMMDNGQAQVRFSMPTGKIAVHQTMMVPIYKLRKAPLNAMGEPNAGNYSYSHIDPVPSFHPPSLKNSKPVPTDDPQETDNKYLDVQKRKSDATKKFRDSLTRRNHQPPNMGPKGTGAGGVVGVNHTTSSSFAMFGHGVVGMKWGEHEAQDALVKRGYKHLGGHFQHGNSYKDARGHIWNVKRTSWSHYNGPDRVASGKTLSSLETHLKSVHGEQ
jgi:hypothetical protein